MNRRHSGYRILKHGSAKEVSIQIDLDSRCVFQYNVYYQAQLRSISCSNSHKSYRLRFAAEVSSQVVSNNKLFPRCWFDIALDWDGFWTKCPTLCIEAAEKQIASHRPDMFPSRSL
jgi:hypothetical protein